MGPRGPIPRATGAHVAGASLTPSRGAGHHGRGPPGWLRNAERVSYPPAPWHLQGTACVSLWRVEADELPAGCLPPGARPVTLLGRAVVVGTGWAVHEPGGVLACNEVLAAVRVRVRGR